jgi:hypothetical protein
MMLNWDTFWATFWPGLAATIVGVLLAAILGIPAGLAVDRFVRRRTARETGKVEAQILERLRDHLCDAMDRNIRSLSQIAQLPDGAIWPVTGLEVAVWDVWKADVIRLVPDPTLRGDLALFFGSLQLVEYLNRELLRVTTSVDAAMGGADKSRKLFYGLLTKNAAQAMVAGQEVRGRLATVRIPGA